MLPLKVIPHASLDAVAGVFNKALKVKVTKAPEDGKANKAVKKLLSSFFNLRKNQVSIISGQTSSNKVVRIDNVSVDFVLDRISMIK